jgi:hypothetical protein
MEYGHANLQFLDITHENSAMTDREGSGQSWNKHH